MVPVGFSSAGLDRWAGRKETPRCSSVPPRSRPDLDGRADWRVGEEVFRHLERKANAAVRGGHARQVTGMHADAADDAQKIWHGSADVARTGRQAIQAGVHIRIDDVASRSVNVLAEERRAMILVFLTGFILVYLTGDWGDGWWQAKFVLVLGLAGLHGYFARCVRTFAEDANVRPARFYRILNEAPTVLMILIVVLAVVKPF